MEITEKFDVRFTQLLTELQKQNEQKNQAQETLEKRAAQLSRERELFEEKVKWERDRSSAGICSFVSVKTLFYLCNSLCNI